MIYPIKSNCIIKSKEDNLLYNIKNNRCYRVGLDGQYALDLADGQEDLNEIFQELSKKYVSSYKQLKNLFDKFKDEGIVYYNEEPCLSNPESDKPIRIASIELTNKCNLKCNYCYSAFAPTNNLFLSFDEITSIFEALSARGVKIVELTGGEPSMHKDFDKIIELACEKFHFINIMTNAVYFKESIFNVLKKHVSQIGLSISIDGFSEKSNNLQRGVNNTFKNTLETIYRLKNEINPKSLRVVYMLTNLNINEVEDFCDNMISNGINNLLFSIPEDIERGRSYQLPDGSNMSDLKSKSRKELENQIVKIYNKYEGSLKTPTELIGESNQKIIKIIPGCGAGWHMLSIKSNGDVIPCNLMDDKFILGNIKSDLDLNFLSTSNEMYKLFSEVDLSMFDNKRECCMNCEYLYYCNKCLFKVIKANKNRLLKGEQLCPIIIKNNFAKFF